MIGVLVRDQHAIEPVDIGADELLAQVGTGIDEDTGDAVSGSAFYQ